MKTLQEWLSHLETIYSAGLIDVGLERAGEVKKRMSLQPQCPVVAVAGTNGKGSVCAYSSQVYTQTGSKVDTLTGPHPLRYNERITVNTRPVEDAVTMTSFERTEAVHAGISLTYFEFNTLAAIDIFIRERADAMALEVGLGGRLDAVNMLDADCTVVTSMGLNHWASSGDMVEQAAFEKVGMSRGGEPAICGQTPPPESLYRHVGKIGVELLPIKRDFDLSILESVQWSYRYHSQNSDGRVHNCSALPPPALRDVYQLSNVACVLTVLKCLDDRLPVDITAIKRGLLLMEDLGYSQVLSDRPLTVLDVDHDPHAARTLHCSLINLIFVEKCTAVSSILADKDMDGVLDIVRGRFGRWHIAPLDVPCGMTAEVLVRKPPEHGTENVKVFENTEKAYRAALEKAGENGRIVVFSSLHTVAAVMAALSQESQACQTINRKRC